MSLAGDVTRYYEERAPVYDRTAGYEDEAAEQLRAPIKQRYRALFKGHRVLEIACGTGYWTQVIAGTAEQVCAIDINSAVVSIARERCSHLTNVQFRIADAYRMNDIPTGFSAAFSVWWWSHIPRNRIRRFLTLLHTRLLPGGLVVFVDQLRHGNENGACDSDGNMLVQRTLPDGRTFEIVKNFPDEEELKKAVQGLAKNIRYTERPREKSWNLAYNTLE
jgi:SAM-dependent methyltransferase